MKSRLMSLVVVLLCAAGFKANAQLAFDIESGVVFPGYNDVRIPGKGGTQLSFTNELKTKESVFVRGRVLYGIGDRSTVSVLVAPLTVTATGSVGRAVVFEGKTFSANTPLDARWKFNSYRATYRYDFAKNESIEFGLGLTAKIRDAAIRISSGGVESAKTDFGFVPLVNFRLHWKASPAVGFLLEADALAAPQGRAEDVLAALTVRLSDAVSARAGYRLLEGGADNDEVYNFSLFHYAAVGLTFSL